VGAKRYWYALVCKKNLISEGQSVDTREHYCSCLLLPHVLGWTTEDSGLKVCDDGMWVPSKVMTTNFFFGLTRYIEESSKYTYERA
jgi:hypothetical protein